jgi:hypothetical protein
MAERLEKVVMINKRPLCECGRAAAINYKKGDRTYYRKKCTHCIAEAKKPKHEPWEIAGYIKKNKCEKCGFKSKYSDQIHVVQVKGMLHTYKSVCLNCEVEIANKGGWKQGDLTPDV